MVRYLQKRLLLAIPTIMLTSIVVFLMLYLIPGDPASIYLGDKTATPERLAEMRHIMGLDRPLYVQYGDFVWKALHGDLGRSLQTGQPVSKEIRDRLPNTAALAIAAMALAIVVGVGLGILSGLNRNSWLDTVSMSVALVGVSVPIFWLALLLIMLFAVRLQWFPATSQPGLRGLVLPAVSLALLSAATLARLVRSSILEVLQQEYLTTARAKGLRRAAVVLRHAIPNALIPVITVIGLQFGSLLSGAVITETVFARPGLGKLVVDSIQNKDFPVVQGVILVLATIYVVINLLVDVAYAVIDPRIRLR
ncbi:ABC transporter permease [Sphaerobacter sp.]|uniref:ABC transporter permease n=1 Tax=Sphaerobacter sp. TaxID=2099654 RepID=UPI001DDD7292|nr:ABC transporter permease [Sphaerobacter sp.]MBX5446180.1 ABC transporter permease [Sphaerobacter sp.]